MKKPVSKVNDVGRGGGTINPREDVGRAGRKKIRVIVADDDQDVADTISSLLEEKGMDVVAKAFDGEEASKLYFTHKPDVLLLDMSMPNYDGNYAIEKITLKDPDAKIIVITAFLDKYFQNDKVSAVVSKTTDIDKLERKILQVATEKNRN